MIEEKADGVFLDRYAEDGRFGGDTWHFSVQEAKEQAEDEYPGLLTQWKEVPREISGAGITVFALAELKDT